MEFRRRRQRIFWGMFLAGVVVACIFQYRATTAEKEKQRKIDAAQDESRKSQEQLRDEQKLNTLQLTKLGGRVDAALRQPKSVEQIKEIRRIREDIKKSLKDKAAKQPPLMTLQYRPAKFPLEVSPHSVMHVLRLWPEPSHWNLQVPNDTGSNVVWPPGFALGSAQPHELVFYVEVTNQSSITLLDGSLQIHAIFQAPTKAGSCENQQPGVQPHEQTIEIPLLRPQETFGFYIVNQSQSCVSLTFPRHIRVTEMNTRKQETIEVIWDKKDGIPFLLPPTRVPWDAHLSN